MKEKLTMPSVLAVMGVSLVIFLVEAIRSGLLPMPDWLR